MGISTVDAVKVLNANRKSADRTTDKAEVKRTIGLNDEDYKLWVMYKQERNAEAFKRLVEKYIPLVVQIAYSINKNLLSNVTMDDLISSGTLGLIDAIEKYDLNKSVKFKTYAQTRIRGAILDSLRDIDWIPYTSRKRIKELQKAYSELEKMYGRPATNEEVAKYLGISMTELHQRLKEANQGYILSTNDVIYSTEDGDIIREETLPSSVADPEREAMRASLKEDLKKALAKLPERERLVVYLHPVRKLPHKQIAKILGVSDSRVSQLYAKGLSRLRAYLEDYYSAWVNDEV